ncbi:MAG TPA: hypothetical protein VGV18_01575 [Verrucomicrobiae bacterium]|nr:hypothetical protein [Verrucomicrobiae bacterium]
MSVKMSVKQAEPIENKGICCLKSPSLSNGRFPHPKGKQNNENPVSNAQTGKQQSLKTSNRSEAQRLVAAKNEAINNAQFTLAIGQTYLAVTDAQILTRTWKEAMDVVAVRGFKHTKPLSAGVSCPGIREN